MTESKSFRVVIKLGTSSICDPETHLPTISNLSLLIETIQRLRLNGHKVVLVSSGAVGVGLRRLNLEKKPEELSKAVAAVGQGRLMSLYDDLFGQLNQPIAQILITKNDLADRTQYCNACNTLEALFEMGVVPIVNENDTISVGEIRFGDNDTLSAITAGMIHADILFLLTDVDCMYSDNPRTNPNAKPVRVVDDISLLKQKVRVSAPGTSVGTGGMVTKMIAAELATAAGVTTVISRGSQPQNILRIMDAWQSIPVLNNEELDELPNLPLFTIFTAKPYPMVDRKWWILNGIHPAGSIVIDQSCVTSITRYNKSIFASGITDVEGKFISNQGVRVLYVHGTNGSAQTYEIGKGLVNYDSVEIQQIQGVKSRDIAKILGYADSESVVHKNNLVITIDPKILDTIIEED